MTGKHVLGQLEDINDLHNVEWILILGLKILWDLHKPKSLEEKISKGSSSEILMIMICSKAQSMSFYF